ncbi:MAG: hypothetical protein WD556_07720 [Actinomycetota bacterium]
MSDAGLTGSQVREEVSRYLGEYLPHDRGEENPHVGASEVLHYLEHVRGFDRQIVRQAENPVMEELSRLLICGVIRLGYGNGLDSGWITLTSYGKRILNTEGPPVYDPEGYAEHLRGQVPDVPEVAMIYLREAVSAFNLQRTLGAAVMLGVASEALLVMLIEAFAASPAASNSSKLTRSLEREPITRTLVEFDKQLDRADLPAHLQKDLGVYLGQISEFIRVTRNQAGHPTGFQVERPVVEAQLRAFEAYAERLCSLASHFKARNT